MKRNQPKVHTSPNKKRLQKINRDPSSPENILFPVRMIRDRHLTPHAKVVYMLLPSSGDWDNSGGYSDKDIAESLGLTMKEVRRYKEELFEAGYADEEGRLP